MTAEAQVLELVEQPKAEPRYAVSTTGTTPADLLRIAIDSGADLDRLERLMAMQVQYEEREAKKLYNVAFAAFKAEAVVIIKNKTVQQGPLAGGKYAELFAVVNAVTPALSKHGLSTSWRLTKDDKDWIEITCTLKHAAGYFESVSMGGPPDVGGAKSALQARASTQTFLERYTLKAVLGVAEQGDDTDGNTQKAGASEEDEKFLQAGRDASMQGSDALTKWWASLNAKQRGKWSKEFGGMRKVATDADARATR